MSLAKQQRRTARLEARRASYTPRPPRRRPSRDGHPKGDSSQKKGLYVPIFGKTMFDENMGAEFRRIGKPQRQSVHGIRRRNPAKLRRRAARKRLRLARALSFIKAQQGREACERGNHLWTRSAIRPDTAHCCRRGCDVRAKIREDGQAPSGGFAASILRKARGRRSQ